MRNVLFPKYFPLHPDIFTPEFYFPRSYFWNMSFWCLSFWKLSCCSLSFRNVSYRSLLTRKLLGSLIRIKGYKKAEENLSKQRFALKTNWKNRLWIRTHFFWADPGSRIHQNEMDPKGLVLWLGKLRVYNSRIFCFILQQIYPGYPTDSLLRQFINLLKIKPSVYRLCYCLSLWFDLGIRLVKLILLHH